MYRIGQEELNAVARVIETRALFKINKSGQDAMFAEEEMKEKFGTSHALLMTSGHAALTSALIGMGIGPGDEVIVPAYTYISSAMAVVAAGAMPVIVEVDDTLTLSPKAFEAAITKNTKAVIPVHIQGFPCKMDEICEIAKKNGIVILEDNPYGELRFAGEEIPTIKSFDEDGLVVYCSSFSKILSAGMRVGFVIGPADLLQKMVVAKQCEDVHTNNFFQMLCYKYVTECDLDAHIEKIRAIYRHKCNLMLDTLDKEMPKEVKYTRPEGGLFIWCTLPAGLDSGEFAKFAISKKIAVVPGSTFNCDTKAPSDSFRINYSTPSDEQIVNGVKVLAEAVREYIASKR